MDYRLDAYNAADEVIKAAKLEEGDLLVVGCSTSEIIGSKIGSDSQPNVAEEVFLGIWEACKDNKIWLAAQCCEHLNRALILEKTAARERGYDRVNVIPQPKAGGSFATMAYKYFESPYAVEHIKADAGMDIGDTLIGMHMKEVCVPLRISVKKLGEANLVCARVRAKFVGGERAIYDHELM